MTDMGMPVCLADSIAAGRFEDWVGSQRLAQAQTIALARDIGWRGVDFCVGVNNGADFDDVFPSGHFIGIQLNQASIEISVKTERGWTSLLNPPDGISILPSGQRFSMRHHATSYWAALLIPRKVLDGVLGSHTELAHVKATRDEILASLLRSLAYQMSNSDPSVASNRQLSEQLVRTAMVALARYRIPSLNRGGLTAFQMRTLRDWVRENLGNCVRVEQMADFLNLSKSHFTREFKRSTGLTPWEFVVSLRADLAHELLSSGASARSVVAACGFSDQSHLCRVVKEKFGVSPSQLRRQGPDTLSHQSAIRKC